MAGEDGGVADSGVRPRAGPGDRIGNYEIIGKLASGGMAELFVAKRVGLEGFQKVVVLKRILPHLAENPEFVEMFLAEARLAATLEHPNIVHVSDIGKEGRDFFFTMAYIHGKDLLAILRRSATLQQRFPLSHALTVALGICDGLHYAHEQIDFQGQPLGIVHRDISPANVLVTWHGNVKVVDFGIAKAATQTGVTQVGVRKGKASYMAPEQCRAKDIDRRSDIWAIGVVLFEITTMTRLFKAENELAIMHRIVTGDVPLPETVVPDYPPRLSKIVMKCLELDSRKRYATAQELRRDLASFAHEMRISTSTDALGDYLRELYPPEAKQLPWASTEPHKATSPQHVPSIRESEAPTRMTSSGPIATPATPGTSSAGAAMDPPTNPSTRQAPAVSTSLSGGTSPGTSRYGPQGTEPGHAGHAGAPVGTQPAGSAPRPITSPMPAQVPTAAPATPAPGQVDPRGWENTGTTDTHGPGQVTRTGADDAAVVGRPVAAWITAGVIGAAAIVGIGTWALWPADKTPPAPAPPAETKTVAQTAAPDEERLSTEQILVLVNQPDPDLALDYKRRHALLDRLGQNSSADRALQVRLDLLQATEAPDPCGAFTQALETLEKNPDVADRPFLAKANPPEACSQLADRLAKIRG